MPVLFIAMSNNEIYLSIRRYRPEDNRAVTALHLAGLSQFGAVFDPYYDSDLDDIEGVYLNNHGEFLVGVCNEEVLAMGAIRRLSDNQGV